MNENTSSPNKSDVTLHHANVQKVQTNNNSGETGVLIQTTDFEPEDVTSL